MSSEQDRRRHAEFLAVGFLTTDQLDAGIVKATFTSHDRLADVLRAVLQLHHTTNDSVELGTQYYELIPEMKAALASIPTESALKEAHDG